MTCFQLSLAPFSSSIYYSKHSERTHCVVLCSSGTTEQEAIREGRQMGLMRVLSQKRIASPPSQFLPCPSSFSRPPPRPITILLELHFQRDAFLAGGAASDSGRDSPKLPPRSNRKQAALPAALVRPLLGRAGQPPSKGGAGRPAWTKSGSLRVRSLTFG